MTDTLTLDEVIERLRAMPEDRRQMVLEALRNFAHQDLRFALRLVELDVDPRSSFRIARKGMDLHLETELAVGTESARSSLSDLAVPDQDWHVHNHASEWLTYTLRSGGAIVPALPSPKSKPSRSPLPESAAGR